MAKIETAFDDPDFVAHYAEGPPRFVPGFYDLHKMSGVLLSERCGNSATVLALGAGGGLELKSFSEDFPDWTFIGVDPSSDMIGLAKQILGEKAHQVDFHEGFIFDAPKGPFDAATALLTLHFLPAEERVKTLIALRERLKPGAPFIMAHSSFPQGKSRDLWLDRYAAFATAAGEPSETVTQARSGVAEQTTLLQPEQDEATLKEAGSAQLLI